MTIPFDGLTYAQRTAGNTIRIRYYTGSITGSVWDDDRTLTTSGTDFYISGIVRNIDGTKGSEDQVLLEQGRIRYNDIKLYMNGSLTTTSGVLIFTAAISGLNRVYRENELGISAPQYLGNNIYKMIYLTEIPLGSLL